MNAKLHTKNWKHSFPYRPKYTGYKKLENSIDVNGENILTVAIKKFDDSSNIQQFRYSNGLDRKRGLSYQCHIRQFFGPTDGNGKFFYIH